MIQVLLHKIDINNKTYSITLGNGCHFDFNNLKKAKAFNAETSRFLTKKVLLLNEIYNDLFTLSRKQWVISENRQGKGKNTFFLYQKIHSSLDNIGYWFEYLVSYRCYSAIYSFICVEKITREFEQLFNLFSEAFSAYPTHYFAIDIEKSKYINRQIIQEVRNYGINDCTKVIEMLVTDFEKHLKETFLKVG